MKNIYIIGIVIFIVFSCKPKEEVLEVMEDGAATVTITHSAGDRWSENDEFLPLPVNVASFGDKEVFVISDRLNAGKRIEIDPIGAVKLIENDSLKTYLISIPSQTENQIISVEDFDEFSTIHSSAKWILEQYLVNRLGSNKSRVKSWENENFALNYLLK